MLSTTAIIVKKRYKKLLIFLLVVFGWHVPSTAKTFIIDGEEINIAERPYTALIVNAEFSFLASCSGVVIDEQWILTAGHCVDEGTLTEDILVKVDVNDSSGNGQLIEVEKIFIHPGFITEEFTRLGNDIALLKLKTPVTFNNRVQKIDLATSADANLITPGTIGTLSGWGDTSTDPEARANFRLHTVDLPIVSLDDANNVNAFNGRLKPNMLAAGSRSNNKGSCKGDSGGPFVVPDGNGGQLLAGITSFGQCDEDVNGPFSVFTRVSVHQNWIQSVLNGEIFAWFNTERAGIFDFEFLDVENATSLNNDNLYPTTYNWEVTNTNNEVIFTSTLFQPRFSFPSRGNYNITLTATNQTGSSTHQQNISVQGRCATFPKINTDLTSVLRSGNRIISGFKENNILSMGYPKPINFDQVISEVTVFFDTPLVLDRNSDLSLSLEVLGDTQEGFAEVFLPDVKNEIDANGKYTFVLDKRVRINSGDGIFEISIRANGLKSGDNVNLLTINNPNSEVIFTTTNNGSGGEEIIGTELALELGVCRSLNANFNQTPWVGFTNPVDFTNFNLGDKITLTAIAEDPENDIERVNFRVNEEQFKSDNSAPYEQIFEPTEVGQYDFEAVVIDGAGNRNRSFVTVIVTDNVNVAPQVAITSPANNAEFVLGEEINLAATASDPDGNLDRVNFKINDKFFNTDNTQPFETTFTPTEAGRYVIGARAFDKDELATEVTVTINVVVPNQSPTLEITSPTEGQIFTLGEEIFITANASDPDGNLDRVNFKINDEFYQTDKTAPFESSFTPTEAGIYIIGARAFDNQDLAFERTVSVEVVDPTLSTNVFKKSTNHIKLYPSPASDVIRLDGLTNENNHITIIDISGKKIKELNVAGQNAIISVSDLTAGMYFLKLKETKAISFIKN